MSVFFYNTLSTYLFVKNEEFQFLELVETIDRELELEKYIYIYETWYRQWNKELEMKVVRS